MPHAGHRRTIRSVWSSNPPSAGHARQFDDDSNGAAILEMPVSDRDRLEDLSQLVEISIDASRKLLILIRRDVRVVD